MDIDIIFIMVLFLAFSLYVLLCLLLLCKKIGINPHFFTLAAISVTFCGIYCRYLLTFCQDILKNVVQEYQISVKLRIYWFKEQDYYYCYYCFLFIFSNILERRREGSSWIAKPSYLCVTAVLVMVNQHLSYSNIFSQGYEISCTVWF